jgi:hypothetical protein
MENMITNNETLRDENLILTSKGDETVYKLKKGYRGVVCMNCPSYMCGLRHIWTTKKIAE